MTVDPQQFLMPRRMATALTPAMTAGPIQECWCPAGYRVAWLPMPGGTTRKPTCISNLTAHTPCMPHRMARAVPGAVPRARRGEPLRLSAFGQLVEPSIEVLRGYKIVGKVWRGGDIVTYTASRTDNPNEITAYVWAGAACAAGQRVFALHDLIVASREPKAMSERPRTVDLLAMSMAPGGTFGITGFYVEELGCPVAGQPEPGGGGGPISPTAPPPAEQPGIRILGLSPLTIGAAAILVGAAALFLLRKRN